MAGCAEGRRTDPNGRGVLARSSEKIYVQDRLWERRRDLIEWLDGGANFYVCGDANAMAKDVRATLGRAYADVKSLAPEAAEQAVAQLERDKRYLTDTY